MYPYMKCEFTILDTTSVNAPATRMEHSCSFPLPILLLKFLLPWEVSGVEFDAFGLSSSEASGEHKVGRKLVQDFPESLLCVGGLFFEVEAENNQDSNSGDTKKSSSKQPKSKRLSSSLVRHGSVTRDLNIAVRVTEKLITVFCEDARLGQIVLKTLQQFWNYCSNNFEAMRDGTGQNVE